MSLAYNPMSLKRLQHEFKVILATLLLTYFSLRGIHTAVSLDKLSYVDVRTLIRHVLNYSTRLGTCKVYQMAL